MKKRKNIFLVILISITLLAFLFGYKRHHSLEFLRVEGDQVLFPTGKPIRLMGLNLEFKYFQTYLNKTDIRNIAELGANSIRLVLDYRDLEKSPYQYDEEKFSRLDDVINWCEKYRLYMILDLHLAPGAQNGHDFVVHRQKEHRFWENDDFQERFYALWRNLAKRYANKTIIAAYDILNEGTPPSIESYRRIMNKTIEAIRAYDANHILIVEEAILSDWQKELFLVKDPNTIYSIHFFLPPEFAFYCTTMSRPITTYPGDMVCADRLVSKTESSPLAGNKDWHEIKLTAKPPADVELLLINIVSQGINGRIWFDDITLNVDGQNIDLPAPMVANNSFEIDYPGFNWEYQTNCPTINDQQAKTGEKSLLLENCAAPTVVRSSPIKVKKGFYKLSASVKLENSSGEARLILSWHKKKVLRQLNRKDLRAGLDYAFRFKQANNVPLYVGEFTAHRNPSSASVTNYLSDLLSIMEDEGLHWSFWEYYSPYIGVGLWGDNKPRIVNQAAVDVLRNYMLSKTHELVETGKTSN